MESPHFINVKLVVVSEGFNDRGYVVVEPTIEKLHTVGHLAKYLYEGPFKNRRLVSSEMKFYVADSVGEDEPIAADEVTALSTSRLQTLRDPKSLKRGSHLLAVVDSLLPTQGKHNNPSPVRSPVPPHFRATTVPRLLQSATSGLPRGLARCSAVSKIV